MNKKAFTLSEVLITLTILGIIAAITIPTLSAAAQKHGFATSVRKMHSNLSNAFANYMAIHDLTTLSNSNLKVGEFSHDNQEALDKFLENNFKVTKTCHRNNSTDCLAENYKSVDGKEKYRAEELFNSGGYGDARVLADGSVIFIDGYNSIAYVDINGKKGPNILGYDFWSLKINDDGTIGDLSGNNNNNEGYGLNIFNRLARNDWVIDW